MLRTLTLIAATALMGACSYVDRYEAGVYHYEPTYCYQSIGAVRCYRTPNHRDEKRLVNYYGPHPTRFEKPPAAEKPVHNALPPVSFYVRDPEPVPAPVPPRSRTTAAVNGQAPAEAQEYETDFMMAPATPTKLEFKVPTTAQPVASESSHSAAADSDDPSAPRSAPVVPVQRNTAADPVVGL
jgi:hypothetical protein